MCILHKIIDWSCETCCLEAINRKPYNLVHVQNKTLKICCEAVRLDGQALQGGIPKEIWDNHRHELYYNALVSYPRIIEHVRWDGILDMTFIMTAVKINYKILIYLEQKEIDLLKTKEISDSIFKTCCDVLKKDKGHAIKYFFSRAYGDMGFFNKRVYVFEDILGFKKMWRLCLKAVRKDGANLKDIPDKYHTKKICWVAVSNCTDAFKYIKDYKQTEKLFLKALKKDGLLLKYASKYTKQLPENVYLEAVKQNGLALEYIDSNYQTREISFEAIKQNGFAFKFVSYHLQTLEICIEAVKNDCNLFINLSGYFKTLEVCLEAVKKNGLLLKHVPCSTINYFEICLEAVKQNGLALEFVSREHKTPKIVEEAVKQNGLALEFVSRENQNPEIVEEAIKQNPLAKKFVRLPKFLKRKFGECSICLDELEDYKKNDDFGCDLIFTEIVNCNHTFHTVCLDNWKKLKTTCPLCRSNMID